MNNARRIGLIVGMVLLLAAIVGGWLGRPAYRRYKENRALTQAHDALRNGDFRSAQLGLRQSLEINSANPEAIRLMAELATEAQSPAALDWRRRAVELSPTFDNKLLLAASGLRVEKPPFPIAADMLRELHAAGGETNAAWHLIAWQFATRLNQNSEAEKHLRVLIQFDPTNRLHLLNLATLHLRAKDVAVMEGARRELTGLTNDPALGSIALRSLIVDALADRRYEDMDRLSLQLLEEGQARFEDQLQRLSGLHEAHSEKMSPWLDTVKRNAGTNVLAIAVTCDWLNNRGLATNALAWLDSLPATVRSTPPLPFVKAECYSAQHDWPGLEKYLQEQPWDDQDYFHLAMLARALREQGRREMSGAQWRRAVGVAGSRVERLSALAQMAAGWGWNAEVEDVLWTVARRAPWLDWAWHGLVRGRTLAGDSAGLYRVANAKLEARPDSIEAKNDAAFYGLLLNLDLDRAIRLSNETFQAAPTNSAIASTHAFALHVQGRSAEGLKILQSLPEVSSRQPDIAVYQAILLSATGQRELAAPYFIAAEKARLLPEERRLLDAARAGK